MKQFTETIQLQHGDNPLPVDPRLKDRITDVDRQRFERLMREKMVREMEATYLYEPLPNQLDFHKSQAMERMLRGSNQAGKTMAAGFEIGWIVSNRHPYIKYPKKGKIIAVGKSVEHIGNVMWDKLTKEDSDFRRIRDLETGKWRSYRRFDAADKARFDETVPMTPIIPSRLIDGEPSWYSKKQQIPSHVRFKTGWELLFFTGGGSPPQGIAVDVVWFDEEIEKDQWYLEMAARVLRKRGKFFWSATAQAGGDQLWNLHLRALEEMGELSPSVTEHPILLSDNKHVEQKLKDDLAKKYAHDPDAYRVRILGEYLITSFHIYPTFSITNHCIEPFEVPRDWCRYMIVDPGTVVCAVLFVAVPPDGSHLYCYDELYIRDCDPQKFGERVKHKTDGQTFQSFIIDDNGSRRTDSSSGTTVRQVYADILKSLKIKSRATGSSFELGASNVTAGLENVRTALHPKDKSKDGKPYIQIFNHCHNLMEEFPRYHKKRNKTTGTLMEEPVQKHNHLLDTLRYAVMHGCRYVKPDPVKHTSNGKKRWDTKRKKQKKPKDGILLGAKGKA
jgi:hypothetical protein